MSDLNIQVAENGFVVNEGGFGRHAVGKMWAFESAESLAAFIKSWGNDIHKPVEALPVLEKGKALIITGGKGTGKTTLARKIALSHGNYTTTSFDEMNMGSFALGGILKDEPNVVIIEDDINEFSESDKFVDFMKPLISNDKIAIDRQGMVPGNVKTPHFIICTGAVDPLKFKLNERRFTVLPL